ncbi:ComEA family DNA-binding protein [Dyadobacter sp. CY326]|uniref:ComEA family DNA-binding protein n=1 Tax=Dyadobacter sp. CY326 TaxID=2907300 RepID=UPI001F429A6A|nr:helix-hairpin-helix domain-containing protein [Dyadobacter sp. CY326]MCE7065650.1 helix-hairpin-helix domain-containing protein [Dyadobacter sp. CY326]
MFKKITNHLQEFFGISKKEARGALVLMILCLFLLWTPFVFRRFVLPVLPIEKQAVDFKKLDSIAVVLERESQVKFKKYKPFPKKEFAKRPPRTVKLSDFDPNSASIDQLETLGIPAFLARRIDKFRSKGGKFRKKEDLLNIYDFPSELFGKLKKHIVFSSVVSPPSVSLSKSVSSSSSSSRSFGARPGVETPGNVRGFVMFDLNLADTAQLVRLRGIGTKLSQRIIKYRDALGGFHDLRQYSEIFGLDSLALGELRRYGKIGSAVKKISINTASAEELGRHPYLRDRKKIVVLVNYRQQHGAFQSLEDLKKVKVLDDDLIKKISPYLSFD